MSATIDERVVQMRFDNAQFEQRAKTTLSTLDRLKSALRLSDSANSMNDAARNLGGNFNLLSSSADAVARRFSALEVVGVTALVNIANSAVNAGKQLVKSLTIDPIKQGFGEYELKMGSVQTIMASTGESIEVVSDYLEELNRYADRTIYSFSDMTSNIGKFTNAGVKLEDAVKAIQGISNEAAVSGANANEASRAMYNFSQALSAGYVKLIDWKSIENANMATVEFKNQLIETALAMGTVKKEGDLFVSTTKDMNGKVSAAFDATKNFNDSLSAQWMTSEVLVQALSNYSTDIRDMTAEEKKAYEEKLKTVGYTEEQIKKIEELGQKAFDAAQDVKTFTQLMDTLKEAAGSGWAQTFEIIFGNLEEAKKLWTDVSKVIGGFIDRTSDARNTMLQEWKDLGGRAALIKSIANAWDALTAILGVASEEFRKVFPPMTGKRLLEITKRLQRFTAGLKESVKELEPFRNFLSRIFLGVRDLARGFKSAGSIILSFIKPIGKAFSEAFPADFGSNFRTIARRISTVFSSLSKAVQTEKFQNALEKLYEIVFKVFFGAAQIIGAFASSFSKGFAVVGDLIGKIASKFGGLDSIFSKISELVSGFIEKVSSIGKIEIKLPKIQNKDSFSSFFEKIAEAFTIVAGAIGTVFSTVGSAISKGIEALGFDSLQDVVNAGLFTTILAGLKKFVDYLKDSSTDIFESFKKIQKAGGIGKALKNISDALQDWQANLKAGAIIKIAAAIGVLAFSLIALSSLETKQITDGLVGIGGLFAELAAFISYISTADVALKGLTAFKGTYLTIISLGLAMLFMASAVRKLGEINMDQITHGLLGLFGIMTILAMATKYISRDGPVEMQFMAKSMVTFAIAVSILALALKGVSSLGFDEIMNGLLGLAGMMAVIVIASHQLSLVDPKDLKTTAASMIGFSIAMGLLAVSVRYIGEMEVDDMMQGLLGVAFALAAIAAFSRIMDSVKIGFGSIAAIVGIVAAMVVLENVIEKFNKVKWEDMGKLGAVMAAFIGMIALFSRIKFVAQDMGGGQLLALAAAMVVISGAFVVFAYGVNKLSALKWDQLGRAAVAFGLFVVGIAAAIAMIDALETTGKSVLKASVSMMAMASAILIFAAAMTVLGSLSWKQVAVGLTAIAGAFLLVGVASAVLSKLDPTNLLKMAVAIAAIGAGILMLTTALAMLAAGGAAMVASIVALLTAVAGLIPLFITEMVKGLVDGFKLILSAVKDLAPAIGDAGIILLTTLCNVLLNCTPLIANTIFQLIAVTLATLANGIGLIVNTLLVLIVNGINALANGIRDNSEAILNAVRNLLSSIIELAIEAIATLLEFIPGIGGKLADGVRGAKDLIRGVLAPDSLADTGKEAATGVASGIQEGTGEVQTASSLLGDAAVSGLNPQELISKFKGKGDFGSLLSEELLGSTSEVESASSALGVSASDAIKLSTEKMKEEGKSAGTGYASSLGDAKDKVKKSAKNLSTNAKNGVKNTVNEFKTSGQNAGEGLAKGIESKSIRVYHAAYATAHQAVVAVNKALQEKSPSRILFKSGAYGSIGLANGFTAYGSAVRESATGVAEGAVDAISLSLAKVSDAVDSNTEFSPKLTPVIDLSKATSAYGDVSSMFDRNKTFTLTSAVSGTMDANNVVLDYISKLDAANAGRSDKVLSAFDKLSSDVLSLGDRIENLELRLDGDKLVGGIAEKSDKSFGMRTTFARRNI